jgi:hypothetical protein
MVKFLVEGSAEPKAIGKFRLVQEGDDVAVHVRVEHQDIRIALLDADDGTMSMIELSVDEYEALHSIGLNTTENGRVKLWPSPEAQ